MTLSPQKLISNGTPLGLTIGVWLVSILAMTLLITLMHDGFGIPDPEPRVVHPWWQLTTALILAPLGETLILMALMRMGQRCGLSPKVSIWPAVIIIAWVHGLLSWTAFFTSMVPFLLMGWQYLELRSRALGRKAAALWVALAHAAINASLLGLGELSALGRT